MGVLYLALDPAIDRLIAVKLLRVVDDELRERFLREARLAARLQHPNIVTIFDVGSHDGQPFIAMEYIAGETLAELIQRKAPLALLRKLELALDACQGLAYAHKNGIVHRDIKPANLMVSRDAGVLKVLDFGIARGADSTLTQIGMLMGTPNYMAPEQIEGKPIDQRADIFAVGLVLYELLVYRQAFKAETPHAVLHQVLHASPKPLRELDAGLDASLITIVERAIAKDPAKRYQRARAAARRPRARGAAAQDRGRRRHGGGAGGGRGGGASGRTAGTRSSAAGGTARGADRHASGGGGSGAGVERRGRGAGRGGIGGAAGAGRSQGRRGASIARRRRSRRARSRRSCRRRASTCARAK